MNVVPGEPPIAAYCWEMLIATAMQHSSSPRQRPSPSCPAGAWLPESMNGEIGGGLRPDFDHDLVPTKAIKQTERTDDTHPHS
jgi:hypothetical protein